MVQEQHGGKRILYHPTPSLIAQADSILHSTPHGRFSLYARVDCIRRVSASGESRLVLSELVISVTASLALEVTVTPAFALADTLGAEGAAGRLHLSRWASLR